ncbi:septum site-determining protein Ssd [Corynebacterium mendelii]|uniref:Septum formation initiator n=1 Tax=Corynebacterium mendelii TaxID=2765362 RepID=A0A939DZP3_9CORY|nr:septum site-determining protein Ssd [Corynebacterium mendelii]MBN9643784.1 hypothetical protein [Corynebacterium mendelii]
MNKPANTPGIVVAVDEPVLHAEAMHVAAASGRAVTDAGDRMPSAATLRGADTVIAGPGCSRYLTQSGWPGTVWTVQTDTAATIPAAAADGVYRLPGQATELLEQIAERAGDAPSAGRSPLVIGVAGACGGAGTSVFAAALAQCRGPGCLLIDADGSPGCHDFLNATDTTPGVRFGDISITGGRTRWHDLHAALPHTACGVAVLAVAAPATADGQLRLPQAPDPRQITAAIGCARGAGAPVVVDTGTIAHADQRVVAALDVVVLVVPAELRAAAAAVAARVRLDSLNVPVLLVVRHRGWSSLSPEDMCSFTGLDQVAGIPTVAGFARQLEHRGIGRILPRALARACRDVLDYLGCDADA